MASLWLSVQASSLEKEPGECACPAPVCPEMLKTLLQAVYKHCSVVNELHWILDAALSKITVLNDEQRARIYAWPVTLNLPCYRDLNIHLKVIEILDSIK